MSLAEQLIKEAEKLKPMSPVVTKIVSMADDPNVNFEEIANVIRYDPAVTAGLLRVCNSAYFSLPRKVETVIQAISLLGMDMVLNITLMKSAGANLKKKNKGYGLNEGELWKNAVASALVAKQTALRIGNDNPSMIFTATLLKDIGKVILDRFVQDKFVEINEIVSSSHLSFRKAEKQVLGIDHAELGGLIAEKWSFAPRMINIIKNHHLPVWEGENAQDICIVYLSDVVCMITGVGGGADALSYEFHPEVMEVLGITSETLQEIIAGFGENLAEVEQLVKVV
ncbi:MAG: HDOD domain-containing protein [Thermodesulfobacteriota bacterium]|nr:HDOD domain-containing protein [Thermodesulfobacteriota bacterium]